MTYVRRDSRLVADQIRPFQTRDILWLTINDLTIVDFYGQNDERDALGTLFQWSVPKRCLVAEAIFKDHSATSSDHLTFPDVRSNPVQPGKIRVTTEDEPKRFVEIVELDVAGIPLTGSTPEELDELASSLLEAGWHTLGTHVWRLFERCLNRRPSCNTIQGRGGSHDRETGTKRPYRTTSMATHLTALLSCVLHPQQTGALPKRSATGLVTALVHDIEEAFARKKVATLVPMDVQGAFNTAMRNRLVLRLRE